MIFIAKAIAILCVGVLVTYVLFQMITGVSNSMKQIAAQKKRKVGARQDNALKSLFNYLDRNPKSKEAFYAKTSLALLVAITGQILLGRVVFSILFFIAVFIMVTKYFSNRAKKQLEKFDDQLIEGIGMITNSVKAGLSILQAIEDMVKNTKPPLSAEFGEALRQIKLGTPANQALNELPKRVPSSDLRIVIMSINIARDTGGNIGEMLTRLAAVMRERKKIQGKIDALTSQGKSSGYIMAVVPFLLLGVLYFLEPEMMGLLFTTLIGNILLALAIGMIALGMFVINKIVAIDI